jgi:hypothetical protein
METKKKNQNKTKNKRRWLRWWVEILLENILLSQNSYVVWLGEGRGVPRGKKRMCKFFGMRILIVCWE